MLGRAAAERPLLLVVEDLQWAGMPTLLLLRHVVRRLEGAPLLVLVTMRDEEANLVADPARLLADLSREHVVERIPLGGLEEADVGIRLAFHVVTVLTDAYVDKYQYRCQPIPQRGATEQ